MTDTDFTYAVYNSLLFSLCQTKYTMKRIIDFKDITESRCLFLRHDVDRWPNNALLMAELESNLGINATYYFRTIPSVFNEVIIKKIHDLGHEIGYHYEDLAVFNGDFTAAYLSFQNNLDRIRKICPVQTICAHGSPLSKWDSKLLWERFDYHESDIIADVGFDFDYNDVFYITDNGRAWNKSSASVRDKVVSRYNIPIKDTYHLIELVKQGQLPDKVMINAHPDTFFEFGLKWLGNYALIESKNIVKKFIVKYGIIK